MEKLNLLAELDELVLRTRDRNSREYIYEAVQAYRAGLSRSAIVNTWTALVTSRLLANSFPTTPIPASP